jgi:uncharacterized membrane protein YfcA
VTLWVLTFLIIMLSAVVQSSTGFGFAIVAIPLLLLLHDGHYAVTLSIVLSLFSCLTTLPRVYKEADQTILTRLFKGSLIGLPAGGLVFLLVDVSLLKLIVSLSILLFTIPLLIRVKVPLGQGGVIGFVSGMLTSSVGMPGPPLVLFLNARDIGKGAFRGTSIAYYCTVYPITLAIQSVTGRVPLSLLPKALAMIPAILIGQALGSWIHNRISPVWFRRITYLLLIGTALNALKDSL